MKIGDLVRLRLPWGSGVQPDRLGIITKMDDMGYFIMNYYVEWQDNAFPLCQLWYRDDELEVVSESR